MEIVLCNKATKCLKLFNVYFTVHCTNCACEKEILFYIHHFQHAAGSGAWSGVIPINLFLIYQQLVLTLGLAWCTHPTIWSSIALGSTHYA